MYANVLTEQLTNTAETERVPDKGRQDEDLSSNITSSSYLIMINMCARL